MRDFGFSIFGRQIMLALQFAASGFDSKLMLTDSVLADEKVVASELFIAEGGRYFLRGDSVPGDLALKAIAIDAEALYLETSPLDSTAATDALDREKLPFRFNAEKRCFEDAYEEEKRWATLSIEQRPEIDGQKLGARILWTVPIAGKSWLDKNAIVRLADAMYNFGCFKADDVEVTPEPEPVRSVDAVPRVQLKLVMQLQQQLKLEQRPMLALRQALSSRLATVQRLELQAIMALQRRILHMTPDEIEEFATRDISPAGQAKTMNIFMFVLAGHVKRVYPQLNWPQARERAWQMVNVMNSFNRR